jgi:hypothetical protein
MARGNGQKQANGSALDFEAQLWAAADKMRGHMNLAAGAPVSDPASFKVTVTNAPDRRSAFRGPADFAETARHRFSKS